MEATAELCSGQVRERIVFSAADDESELLAQVLVDAGSIRRGRFSEARQELLKLIQP
ncbi:hypothetical protein [Enhygromyxa salina]|uniref:hypothetical protein n=1 Tax=Enhygromyxa salina TaxID=215803 RepID=UPI0015E6161F|nr:hypothetical protein [Enhygromyxa salina]